MFYPNSEDKGDDQLHNCCEADLRLCFRNKRKSTRRERLLMYHFCVQSRFAYSKKVLNSHKAKSPGEISPGPKVIKHFSSSAQLSMKFQLLINDEIVKLGAQFRFKTQKLVVYPAHKC